MSDMTEPWNERILCVKWEWSSFTVFAFVQIQKAKVLSSHFSSNLCWIDKFDSTRGETDPISQIVAEKYYILPLSGYEE